MKLPIQYDAALRFHSFQCGQLMCDSVRQARDKAVATMNPEREIVKQAVKDKFAALNVKFRSYDVEVRQLPSPCKSRDQQGILDRIRAQ